MLARGRVVAAARPQGDLAQLEVGQEFVPLGGGELAVLLAGPLGSAAGDEGPVMGDHVLRVDRGIAHGRVQSGVAADLRGDVWGQSGADGVGHEDPSEVVGAPFERVASRGDLGGPRGRDQALADVAAGQRPVLGAVPALEQERHGRAPGLLEHVVGRHQRQGGVPGPDPEDDRGQNLRELRGDQQQALRIGLGRGDLQHRHHLAGGGQGVGDEAVVGEFQHLLDPDAGVPQDFHRGPGPERRLLLVGQVSPPAGGHVGGVDAAGLSGPAALELLPGDEEPSTGRRRASRADAGLGVLALPVDGAKQGGQQRQLGPGPLVHPGLHPGPGLLRRALVRLDRTRRHPGRPPRRIVGGPPGDVLVERPDEHQLAAEVHPRPHRVALGVTDVGQAFLPRLGDLGRQSQRVDAGMVDLQVAPEQPAQVAGDGTQRDVVELGSPLGEVLDQQVPDGPALDAVPVDDLLDAAAALDAKCPKPQRRAGRQHAGLLEQGVEQRPARTAPEVVFLQRGGQLDAVTDGDVTDQAALADHDPGELVQGVGPGCGCRVLSELFEPLESIGVAGGPGLGEHHRQALPQQPRVAGADRLPGDQEHQSRGQFIAPMALGCAASLQGQIGPLEAGVVRPAGHPAILPGLSGLAFEPVQQLAQAPPPGLVAGQARTGVGEQSQQPLDQALPALTGLPPARFADSRFPLQRIAHLMWFDGPGDVDVHGRVHRLSPMAVEVPNSAASTSGRYPGAGGAGGLACSVRCRSWWARTWATTSSGVGAI